MLIDSNIFLEVILEQERCDKCKVFLRGVLEGATIAYLSTFSIDSIVLSMMWKKAEKWKIETFLNSLIGYKGLRFYQIKIKDRLKALKLMQKYSLDYEDAIILQASISTNSEEIVSLDRHFDRVKEIKRIEP